MGFDPLGHTARCHSFFGLFVCPREQLGLGASRVTATTESSRPHHRHGPAASAPDPEDRLSHQHHLVEGAPLVGPAGPVCGTGIWPGLFCPVPVLLMCGDAEPRGEDAGEVRPTRVQPGCEAIQGSLTAESS